MDRDTTRSLSRRLQNIRTESSARKFIAENAGTESFHEYMNRLLARSEMTIADLIDSSCVNRNYIYNIMNGDRSNPSRDRVIALCVGLGAGFNETNRALELVKYSPLYPRDERDARIAIAINRGVRNVVEMNIVLEEHGLEPLNV